MKKILSRKKRSEKSTAWQFMFGSAGSSKKNSGGNLAQVEQDVKFEFSRPEKSTLGQVAEAGKSKVLVQNNILLKITDSLCFKNRYFLIKYYFVPVL